VSPNPFADHRAAALYESWYTSPEGRRVDSLEKKALLWTLGELGPVTSVLEVGCGTGHFTRWLGKKGMANVGLDTSMPMLEQAKLLGTDALVQGDALALPFANGAFDVVALITTLEFLAEPQKALVEGLRVARLGLLLGVMNRWSWLGISRRLTSLVRPNVYDTAHFYSVPELERLLEPLSEDVSTIAWRCTLFPRWWPSECSHLPWGGFVAMVLGKAGTG